MAKTKMKEEDQWKGFSNPLLGFPSEDGSFGAVLTIKAFRTVAVGFASETAALAFVKEKGFDNFTLEKV